MRAPLALTLVMLLASVRPATAQESLGGRLNAVIENLSGPVIYLIAILAFVVGLGLFAKGLMGLIKAGQQGYVGSQNGMGGPLATLVAGAFLTILPHFAGVGITTIFGSSDVFGMADLTSHTFALDDDAGSRSAARSSSFAGFATVEAPTNCIESAATVTCMAGNVAKNVVPVGVLAIFIAAFVIGLAQLMGCLKSAVEGMDTGRGLPPGWFAKLVIALLLMNSIILFNLATSTIFGGGDLMNQTGLNLGSSLLSYSLPGSGTDGPWVHYEEMVQYALIILTLFGAWTFVKGLTVLSAASEGRSQNATVGGGVVFVVAGVLLVNSKQSVCILATTILGEAGSFGFCG